jgi:hypothetical protein
MYVEYGPEGKQTLASEGTLAVTLLHSCPSRKHCRKKKAGKLSQLYKRVNSNSQRIDDISTHATRILYELVKYVKCRVKYADKGVHGPVKLSERALSHDIFPRYASAAAVLRLYHQTENETRNRCLMCCMPGPHFS